MERATTFCRLRAALAPLARPVLTGFPPARWLGLWWLARRQPAEVDVGGRRYDVHPADFGVTFEIASTGDYEPASRAACRSALQPGQTFVDIGAHVGLFAVPASEAVGPSGTVIAFEPDPDNRALLERNLSRHNCDNVTVVPAALADRDGEMQLARSRFNTGDHRISEASGGLRVPVYALDDWLDRCGVVPDVIKMDVQGAEPLVLAGMRRTLEADRPLHVLFEFTPAMLRKRGAAPQALLEQFLADGFTLFMIDERRGDSIASAPADIMRACPARGYVNVHAVRGAA
ncbi:MAG: FkbM family methyltransferase [Phycisphaerales bacterium]|nr:FkbM family methyltransferase [Phycisphaerales bacterium]